MKKNSKVQKTLGELMQGIREATEFLENQNPNLNLTGQETPSERQAKLQQIEQFAKSASGHRIARREAKDKLAVNKAEYRKRLAQTVATVLVIGGDESAQQTVNLSAQEMGAISVRGSAVFEHIADRVIKYLGPNYFFNLTSSGLMAKLVADTFQAYGLAVKRPRVPSSWLESSIGNTEEEAKARLVTMGGEMTRAAQMPIQAVFAQDLVKEDAVRLEITEEPVPVVVIGLTKEDIPEFQRNFFAGRPVVVVDLNEVKNPEGALKAAAGKLASQMGLEVSPEFRD